MRFWEESPRLMNYRRIRKLKLERKHWVILIVTPLVLILDQASKLIIHKVLAPFRVISVIPGYVEFVFVTNRGLVFGMFSDQLGSASTWIFLGFTVIAFAIIVHLFFRTDRSAVLLPLALSLVLAGALGNLIDRFRWGYVVDFIHIHIGRYAWPTFNIADVAITLGIIFLLIDSFRPEPKPQKDINSETGEQKDSEDKECIQ